MRVSSNELFSTVKNNSMRSFMRNLVAMRQMKTKLRFLKPHRPSTVDFPIDAKGLTNILVFTETHLQYDNLFSFFSGNADQLNENPSSTANEGK